MVKFDAMNLHIDKAGRIVLPKAVRQQLGLTPGSQLEVVPSADGVLLRPVSHRPAMQQTDGVWVHQGVSTATSEAEWARIVDTARDERADAAWSA